MAYGDFIELQPGDKIINRFPFRQKAMFKNKPRSLDLWDFNKFEKLCYWYLKFYTDDLLAIKMLNLTASLFGQSLRETQDEIYEAMK